MTWSASRGHLGARAEGNGREIGMHQHVKIAEGGIPGIRWAVEMPR